MTHHVLVGFAAALLTELDDLLPAGSVTVVEDPHAVEARDVRRRLDAFRCVAGLQVVPLQDEARPQDAVDRIRRPPAVTAVLPGLEYSAVVAAAVAEAWGLPGAGLGAARTLRDKLALRAAVAGPGIAQPRWRRVASAAEVRTALADLGGRGVLKPSNRQASVGVELLEPGDDVEAAWTRTTAADEPNLWATSSDRSGFLVEERLTGPEASVEAIVHDRRVVFSNVTAKSVRPGRFPVETGHLVPAPLDPAARRALEDATAALVRVVGFGSGVLHAEWIVVDGVPHLVECAGRLPGDRIHRLIDQAYGTSLVRDMLTVLSGDVPAVPPAARTAAIGFLDAVPGTVTRVRGVDEARALAGVTEVQVGVAAGDEVHDVQNSWHRPGHVMVVADDHHEAERLLVRAAGTVAIETSRP